MLKKFKFMVTAFLVCFICLFSVNQVQAAQSLNNPQWEWYGEKTSDGKNVSVKSDYIWFGSYPQTQITQKNSIYSKLEACQNWDDNSDAIIDGKKYRRCTDKWGAHNVYFRYDPIKWRVLMVKGNKVMLYADKVLDFQPYSDTEVIDEKDSWENCTLRSWLNGYSDKKNLYGKDYSTAGNNFISQAFTEDEQKAIVTTVCYNNDMAYKTNTGKKTKDKIFLPAEEDVCQNKMAEK